MVSIGIAGERISELQGKTKEIPSECKEIKIWGK